MIIIVFIVRQKLFIVDNYDKKINDKKQINSQKQSTILHFNTLATTSSTIYMELYTKTTKFCWILTDN